MKIEKLGRNRYDVNTYIVYDDNTKDTVIIDPAVNGNDIITFIKENDLRPLGILLTHGHIDHIADVVDIKDKYDIPVYVHTKDNEMLMRSELNLAREFGRGDYHFEADKMFRDGDIITFGKFDFKVIHTPGHTKGGTCFLVDKVMFTGDTLFLGSMGRTDLYGGNDEHMRASLRKLMQYDMDIVVYPGHGPKSTIGYEKNNNPFINQLCI